MAIQELGLSHCLTALAGGVARDTAEFRSMVSDSLRFLPVTALLGLGMVTGLVRRLARLSLPPLSWIGGASP